MFRPCKILPIYLHGLSPYRILGYLMIAGGGYKKHWAVPMVIQLVLWLSVKRHVRLHRGKVAVFLPEPNAWLPLR